MKLSIIIPTLNEESELPGALDSVAAAGRAEEVIVVDGGSSDGTLGCLPPGVSVVRSPPGRARQMNTAARGARGEALVFLHADCRLPVGAFTRLVDALREPGVVGGGFHKRFRSRAILLRGVRWRTATWARFGAMFGDQALFVRRAAFARLGGFREDVPAEDWDLVRRLRKLGRLRLLPEEVSVSARRLERQGVLRTWGGWWRIAAVELRRRPDRSQVSRSPTAGDETERAD